MAEPAIKTREHDGSPIVIDRAAPNDAEAIMTLKRDAWLASYPNEKHGISPEDIRKGFTDEELAKAIENWKGGIAKETEGGDRMTFVARMRGKVVGYTSPHTENGKRWLGAMYVAPGAQGKGVGSELIRRAIDWHGPEHDIYLHVVSYNDKAIGFYEHFGFEKTGKETPEEFDEQQGIKLLPEFEMVLKPR